MNKVKQLFYIFIKWFVTLVLVFISIFFAFAFTLMGKTAKAEDAIKPGNTTKH